MIEFQNVSFSYPDHPVLKDLSLVFPDGKISVIIGRNGSGKSTLIRLILQEIQPQSGTILLDGSLLAELSARKTAQKAGFLLQGSRPADLTVRRMVLHGRFCHLQWPRNYGEEDLRAAEDAMRKTGILALADKSLQELSGGELQKALLARLLCQQPQNLLLDEPNTWLDIPAQAGLFSLLKEKTKEGCCVVMVLHDLISALENADLLFVLDHGKLAFHGRPDEFSSSVLCQEIFGVQIEKIRLHDRDRYFYV